MAFTHLHVHTEYSLLDGMCRIQQLVQKARTLGMESLAITDHGTLYGAIEFYKAARDAGIKPIIGCETYLAPTGHKNKTPSEKSNYHLVLLAQNQTGWQNLMDLITQAHLEGFYYKPRIDRQLLETRSEGLIGLSACLAGEVPSLILAGRHAEAREAAMWYQELFKGRFYLEIQRQPIAELELVNQSLIPLAAELGIPLVATNDVHYLEKADAPAHDILLCIGTNATVYEEKRMKMAGEYFYLKSPEEMAAAYQDIPEAITNSELIAASCNLELEFGRLHLPEIERPAGQTPEQYLTSLCYQGLARYYPEPTEEIKKRLEYELDVIVKTEFANYFLVVWDIISFVRSENILFNVRGSAASSIVLRCLGITDIDPLAHGLVFERFLNLERREMPDIDLDFEDQRRDEVIGYVSGKYGADHVAQIITFGTLGARAALRDVGRALGMSYSDVDRVARVVPFAPNMTLARALEESAELRTLYAEEGVKNLIDTAQRVEGISRHASTHAAGVVIAKEELTKYTPLQKLGRGENGELVMTQFPMDDIARIGLLKMDFLGLSNLTILARAKEILRNSRGINIDLRQIPLDDPKTFELLATGETVGVFQLEGSGMRRYIKELKPSVFSDISAMVALYRPGPMEEIPRFIRSKHGLEPIRYSHPVLETFLRETYGVIVYQEQVLFIVREFGGYSLGQADVFRKAMGKKKAEVMHKERQHFIDGAVDRGYSRVLAEEIFALIEPFAGYAFNKAHAVSYALIAYQTAYLKANYPEEYLTALLVAYWGQAERVAVAVGECRRLGIKVLPPDINRSRQFFALEQQEDGTRAIRFGLSAIKNVGRAAVEPIIEERERNGDYVSIEDLTRRVDISGLNRRVMESLVKAGALDGLGDRGTLFHNLGRILDMAQRGQKLKLTGQTTMFDLFGQSVNTPLPELEMENAATEMAEILAWEKELTGVYLSQHPFSPYAARAQAENIVLCGQIDAEMEGQTIRVAGMVASIHTMNGRSGQASLAVVLEDLNGRVEVMVWGRIFAQTRDLWQEGAILLVEGKVRERADQLQVICDRASRYEPAASEPDRVAEGVGCAVERGAPELSKSEVSNGHYGAEMAAFPRRVVITMQQSDDADSDIARLHRLMDLLRQYPGDDEVDLQVGNGVKVFNLKMGQVRVSGSTELRRLIQELIGEGSVKLIDSSARK